MFVMRLGSRASLQIYSENMQPYKKLKTSNEAQLDGKVSENPESSKTDDDLGENWRDKCKDVLETNGYALKKNMLTDITFLVGPDEFVCHAHRLILSLGSPVFEAMFYGTLAENGDNIRIPDMSPEGFQHLLRFMYSGDTTFKSEMDAFKTYIAADKYCVNHLKDECEKFLCSCKLTPSNVWIFLENSVFLNSKAIFDHCHHFLMYSTEIALLHPSFLNVSAKTVETLLSLETLTVPEMKLLQNVIRWAENASQAEGAESFESILRPLLRLIRFGAFTAAQFITILNMKNMQGLLKDHDALAILMHLVKTGSRPLPEWCCTKTWRGCSLGNEINRIFGPAGNQAVNPDRTMKKCLIEMDRQIESAASSSTNSTSSSSYDSSSSSSLLFDASLSDDD